LTFPPRGALVRGTIPVFGVAAGSAFKDFTLEIGNGAEPSEWTTIAAGDTPRTSGNAADVDRQLLMHGDAHLYGNLGNWSAGLGNSPHLPCPPPEEHAPPLGVYTLRLRVHGTDGGTREDRVTIEVGEAVAQALPGRVASADGLAELRIPEQGLGDAF